MRYKEHNTAFHNNNNKSRFVKHPIEEAHSFGPMNSIINVVHCHRKGAHLHTIERFHIHAESAANNCLNDPGPQF
jgi:hypothetical protein